MSTEGEGTSMNTPKVDWTINVSTMIAIGAVALGAGAWLLNLRDTVNAHTGQISGLTTAQAELILKRDARVLEVDRRLAAHDEVRYRVQAVEGALKSTNARVDASLANISTGLREINQTVGGLATNVAVLTQRLESQSPGRRASLEPVPER
ncbi:hypothetical protein [Aureimonas sp. Leaf324]|uniref:hypothetical protein n=1 Tax=Aureimonas sp. Leaf324 TaxID=1736336 RepID=UPI0006F51463|nr:hypothetical protein [Aureimonas sp. Leaf324]KQQ85086.1 hypothetical protein ASF65_19920 [Aureimonas sp. Leaf324]